MNLMHVYIFAAPLLALIGIALAPFAIIVTLVVRRITLSASDAPAPSASKCAVMAFTSSALMFLPWLYMVTRMTNRHFPSFAIKAAYVLLYVRWAMSPIILGPFVGISAMLGWRVALSVEASVSDPFPSSGDSVTLTASVDGPSGASYTYQWQRGRRKGRVSRRAPAPPPSP